MFWFHGKIWLYLESYTLFIAFHFIQVQKREKLPPSKSFYCSTKKIELELKILGNHINILANLNFNLKKSIFNFIKDNLNESHDPQHTKNHNISRTTIVTQSKQKNLLPSVFGKRKQKYIFSKLFRNTKN